MELQYKINAKIFLLALFGVIMVISSYFMFVYEPLLLLRKKVLTLSPGGIFFNMWSKPPVKIYLNLYLFSVTNQEKFINGEEKLTVKEIGPYCFQETLIHTNATFHPNGTVSFIPIRHLTFIKEKSVGDYKTDRLVTPNLPLVGISAMLRDSSMFTNLGLTMISNTANSKSFVNVTVNQYLFGYEDLLIKLGHTALPTWINFENFGLFDRIFAVDNSSNVITMTTDYTKKTPQNPLYKPEEVKRNYYIQEFNGSPGLRHWEYKDVEGNETNSANSRCNFIGGTFDGSLFPSDLTVNDEFRVYRRAFCRPLTIKALREVNVDGFEAIEFGLDDKFLSVPSKNPENACYCKNGKDCLPDGIASIAPCYYGVPITISLPHFYKGAPFLQDQVRGLSPNKSKHESSLVIHKKTGIPIRANLRVQVNVDVGKTKYNAKTIIFNNLHLPLLWLEMEVEEAPLILELLFKLMFDIIPVLQEILKFPLVIFGAAMISCSALLVLHTSKINETTSPLDNLPFSRFSLRRCSDYEAVPVINIRQEYFKPRLNIPK